MRMIDADDAIVRIRKLWIKGEPLEEAWEHDDYAFGLSDAIDAVDDSPTIEPKRGEWIEHEWAEEVEGLLISNYECSECHSWERSASNFCPNCGAKMKGADDE